MGWIKGMDRKCKATDYERKIILPSIKLNDRSHAKYKNYISSEEISESSADRKGFHTRRMFEQEY